MADGTDYAAQRDGGTASYDVPSTGTTVDGALLIGLATGFGLIGAAIMVGDSIRSFLDFPSVLIVLLGSVAVTLVSFSVGEMLAVVPLLLRTLFPPVRDVRRACQRALNLAEIGRRNGVLALDQVLPRLAAEPFLQRAVAMAVDGTAAEKIQTVLGTEIEANAERLARSSDVLRRAAEVAPAMGLIGTLIGLVQMLANLKDPNAIGPAMAVALLTTFYGAVLAYMVLTPVAAKVDRNAADERQIQQIYTIAASSIARQEHPRQLETLLNTVLPPSQRLDFYS